MSYMPLRYFRQARIGRPNPPDCRLISPFLPDIYIAGEIFRGKESIFCDRFLSMCRMCQNSFDINMLVANIQQDLGEFLTCSLCDAIFVESENSMRIVPAERGAQASPFKWRLVAMAFSQKSENTFFEN